MGYRVKAFQYMKIPFAVPGCIMFFQEKMEQKIEVCGYFYLVRGGGHNIVVDTGMGQPPGPEGPSLQKFGNFWVDPGCDTISLLRKEGLGPEDIDVLVLTHLHTDHCWNTSLFPKAKIYMSRFGWEAIQSPRHPALFPDAIYPQQVYKHLIDEAWDRVSLMEQEDEVLPGITTFWVGGHSACSHVVVIETGKGNVILTGDVAFYYANLEENIPVSYNVNLAECYEGMDRIRRLSGIPVPTHDPELLERHPGGIIVE